MTKKYIIRSNKQLAQEIIKLAIGGPIKESVATTALRKKQ